jgi:hypothetical protein
MYSILEQDFSGTTEEGSKKEKPVYLYNQRPGGTGSRGIACVTVTLIDSASKSSPFIDGCHPPSDASSSSFPQAEFDIRIATEEVVEGKRSDGGAIFGIRTYIYLRRATFQ